MATDRATVSGHVVDVNGAPIMGASVELRSLGERTTTDATGAFTLDVPANTTLTLAATAAGMAPTLLQQLMLSPEASTAVELPMLTTTHYASLLALGTIPTGGVVAITVKSLAGTAGSAMGATLELTPRNLGTVMYVSQASGMPDPDPAMTSVVQGNNLIAWALGVQPHVTTMKLRLHGVAQVDPPYAIDDVVWPGTFTVDAGALTLLTLVTP